MDRVCNDNSGEYIFFPVRDDQIFLPGQDSYDLSPHKLDILCQDIRAIERKNKWQAKRIIVVGDRYHKSFVQSEQKKGKIRHSEDTISLETIAEKHKKVTIIDPTDLVVLKIIEIADGRKIAFSLRGSSPDQRPRILHNRSIFPNHASPPASMLPNGTGLLYKTKYASPDRPGQYAPCAHGAPRSGSPKHRNGRR